MYILEPEMLEVGVLGEILVLKSSTRSNSWSLVNDQTKFYYDWVSFCTSDHSHSGSYNIA